MYPLNAVCVQQTTVVSIDIVVNRNLVGIHVNHLPGLKTNLTIADCMLINLWMYLYYLIYGTSNKTD